VKRRRAAVRFHYALTLLENAGRHLCHARAVRKVLLVDDDPAFLSTMEHVLTMEGYSVATASDGASRKPSSARPHPRNFGTFPRKIGLYAIEKKEIGLAFAIRSSSGLPAEILGLKDRGLLKPGWKADVVVFDPATFRDRATFQDPNQYSTGARWVFVNGVAVIADGKKVPVHPGRPLRLRG